MNINEFINAISAGAFDEQLKKLYGSSEKELLKQKARYISAAEHFSFLFPERDEMSVFSAPSYLKIGGNYNENHGGCVLAAAVNPDIIAFVAFHNDGVIRYCSEEQENVEIQLNDAEVHENETGTTAELIRAIAAGFSETGLETGGFDAYISSEIPAGERIDSAAVFEILIGTIIDKRYNSGQAKAEEIAEIGHYAEKNCFGKSGSIVDKLASSVGGFVLVDFEDTVNPELQSVPFDFANIGYSICIVNTTDNHSDINQDYVMASVDMKNITSVFKAEFLREVDEEDFYDRLPELRSSCDGSEILSAAYFFSENRRVLLEADALCCGNTEEFFNLVNESVEVSATMLQNMPLYNKSDSQEISLAIMMSRRILCDCGAISVQASGTIAAFVPNYLTVDYCDNMNRIFGENRCRVLSFRSVGGIELSL